MRTLPANTPTDNGTLFDCLHEWFGVGVYVDRDPDNPANPYGDPPWWKFRQIEAIKIANCRKRWDLSVAELYVAALYCKAHGIHVPTVGWLPRHVKDAWRWWDNKIQRVIETPDEAYAEAVRVESANPDATWLNRLLRAAPAYRAEVYTEWQTHSKIDQGVTVHPA